MLVETNETLSYVEKYSLAALGTTATVTLVVRVLAAEIAMLITAIYEQIQDAKRRARHAARRKQREDQSNG